MISLIFVLKTMSIYNITVETKFISNIVIINTLDSGQDYYGVLRFISNIV